MDEDPAHELVTNGQQAVDELSRTVSQCTDSISSAASELTHARSGKQVASAASELKQASRHACRLSPDSYTRLCLARTVRPLHL